MQFHTQDFIKQKNALQDLSIFLKTGIDSCTECSQVCSHVMIYCLSKGEMFSEVSHIRLLMDCAKACDLCANFMIRESDFHSVFCGACADICLVCAESCEAFEDRDATLEICARVCRDCAEICQDMV